MNRRIRIWTIGLAALSLLTAAGAGAGPPSQHPESWSTPLVISAADFRTNGNDRESFYFSSNGYITGEGSIIVMIAPVYLPNGSTVRNLTGYVYDNSTSCAYPEVTVWLNRVGAVAGDTMRTMASVTTSGSSALMQSPNTSSISYSQIDTNLYAYYAVVMMCSASHELHSVAIHYEE